MPKKSTSQITPEMLVAALSALFVGGVAPSLETETEDDEPKPSRRSRSASKKPDPMAQLKEAAEKYKEAFSLKELKELLKEEAGCTVVSKVEADFIPEMLEIIEAELEAGEEGEGDDDEANSEVTQEAVKIAVQAYQKKNGKEETTEILEEYGIASVRSLGKLEQEQLEDLYADVTEV